MPVLTEELTRMKAHRWQISCLGFSPDGSQLASGGWDKEVNIWDLSNLEVVNNLNGRHKVPVTSVCWHRPNGLLICTGSADNTAALWNAENGQHLSTLTEHFGWVLGCCFSATGSFLATASWDKTVRIWDPGSEMLINNLNGHTAGVWSVDFHPRTSTLCSASEDGTIKIWDARSNRNVRTLSGGHSDAVYCARWSPNGAMIASGSADTKICIWEPGTGALINTIYGHVDTVKSVAFNQLTDNVALPVLASAGDFTIRLSDPRPSQRADILSLSPHTTGKEVEAVAISPDGSLLVSGGRDGVMVLMTLFVPSIMPRMETEHSISSILRKSRVIQERSYIYDVTSDGELPPEFEEGEEEGEEEGIEAELEADALDRILTEPKKPERQTSFTRLKRRSRIAEKGVEVRYATVRRKGISARAARGKRIKEKVVDIPTMVAHLSAAIRAYGPENLSSSESEEEEEEEKEESQEQQAPPDPVDVASRVAAFSNPYTFSPVQLLPEMPMLPATTPKLKERKQKFERQAEEPGTPPNETELEYFANLMPEEENALRRSYDMDESVNFDAQSLKHASGHYTFGVPDYYNSSLRFDDFGFGESMDEEFKTSSPRHEVPPEWKRPSFAPTLPSHEEDNFAEDIGSGDEYGDEVPLSMI